MESNVTVEESKSIRLGCSIPSQSSRDSRFSVSWYVEHFEDMDDDDLPGEEDRKRECVFSIGHDAVFGNGNCSPRDHGGPNSRLQFERMTSDQYSLTIQGALPTDSGRYYCHVEEWLLNPRNAWYRLTTNNSGFTIVNVLPQGKTLITHLTCSPSGCLINLVTELTVCLLNGLRLLLYIHVMCFTVTVFNGGVLVFFFVFFWHRLVTVTQPPGPGAILEPLF